MGRPNIPNTISFQVSLITGVIQRKKIILNSLNQGSKEKQERYILKLTGIKGKQYIRDYEDTLGKLLIFWKDMNTACKSENNAKSYGFKNKQVV